jgi:hypothetical protein
MSHLTRVLCELAWEPLSNQRKVAQGGGLARLPGFLSLLHLKVNKVKCGTFQHLSSLLFCRRPFGVIVKGIEFGM